MIGSGLNDLSPVSELLDNASSTEGTATGYYCLPATLPACSGQYLRFRIYITDIAVGFNVTPEVDLGGGFVPFTSEPLATIISATGPNDSGPPIETRVTLSGFQDINGNIFAADMTFEPMGCLENVIPGDACDCDILTAQGIDICDYITANPFSAVATADCDGGGVDNATECANGGDPNDPSDDCSAAAAAGTDICAFVLANPTSPLALADCDGGGIDNLTECQNGDDPFDPIDDNMSCADAAGNAVDLSLIHI